MDASKEKPNPVDAAGDSLICYCFNKTRLDLVACHKRQGSLAGVQAETKVGTNCGGCNLLLDSLFGETPADMLAGQGSPATNQRFCVRPGEKLMTGFVAADHELDTVILASNAAPPQFGTQDTTVPVEIALLDREGRRVLGRRFEWKSGEIFHFDTREENLPRPLHGMFLFLMGRSNYGAARFNSVWLNGVSSCSTHEINHSGRPVVTLPLFVDGAFLEGPNTVFLAVQNPHGAPVVINLVLSDEENREVGSFGFPLGPRATRWIDANRECYGPALEKVPGGRLSLRVQNHPVNFDLSPTTYFFFHNRNTNLWSVNHL